MNNNLPQKYNSNILNRFLGFIRKLLFREKDTIDESKKENNFANKKDNINFVKKIKVEEKLENTQNEKDKFMENLKKNPDLLENFSNDRLEKILKYYKDENEKKRETLKKITA